jgi:hypothetical protein
LAATEAFFFGVVAGAMGRFSFLRLPTRVAMSGGRVVQLALHKSRGVAFVEKTGTSPASNFSPRYSFCKRIDGN